MHTKHLKQSEEEGLCFDALSLSPVFPPDKNSEIASQRQTVIAHKQNVVKSFFFFFG